PFDTQRRRKDGTLIDVSISVSPIRSPSGEIIGASKVARDITERLRLDRVQKELRDHLEFLAEVGAQLTSSLDYEATLDRAVHIALPRLGDYCNVLVQDEHGVLRHAAWGHVIREKEAILRQLTLRLFDASISRKPPT